MTTILLIAVVVLAVWCAHLNSRLAHPQTVTVTHSPPLPGQLRLFGNLYGEPWSSEYRPVQWRAWTGRETNISKSVTYSIDLGVELFGIGDGTDFGALLDQSVVGGAFLKYAGTFTLTDFRVTLDFDHLEMAA